LDEESRRVLNKKHFVLFFVATTASSDRRNERLTSEDDYERATNANSFARTNL